MAEGKAKSNRYSIAFTVAESARLKRYKIEIPALKTKKSQIPVVIELLRDIKAGNTNSAAFSAALKKLEAKSPTKNITDPLSSDSKILREWLHSSIEKVNTFNSLIDVAKQKLLLEKLITTDLADLGKVKLGDANIPIHNILYLVFDALGNRTTSGKEASIERAKNQRGGVFFEFLIPLFKETQLHEKKVAIDNITHYLKNNGREQDIASIVSNIEAYYDGNREYKSPNLEVGEKIENLPLEKSTQIINNAFNVAGRLAPGIHIFRETEFRADGKEVSDYFSGFLIVHADKKTVTIIPNAIGESKFESVTPNLIPQLIETVLRFSKKSISSESLSTYENINILWGKSLLTIMQSEVEPPVAQFKNYEEKIRKSATSKNLKVQSLKLTKGREAMDARKIIEIFINIAKEFKKEQDIQNKTKK